jgi:hypothetical protein
MAKLNLRTGILGAFAFSLSFGAVQLASGHDQVNTPLASSGWELGVNSAAKTDRADRVAASVPMRTFSVQPEGLANTSVLIRIPLRRETENTDRAKRPIACEPVVSVLTEIAKRLQPGRCVT